MYVFGGIGCGMSVSMVSVGDFGVFWEYMGKDRFAVLFSQAGPVIFFGCVSFYFLFYNMKVFQFV
jgi:hypothetical protein